jgi:hypothetical protein
MNLLSCEGTRQVGFGLSFSTSRTRSPVIIVLARLAVLAAIVVFIGKVGYALVGWSSYAGAAKDYFMK